MKNKIIYTVETRIEFILGIQGIKRHDAGVYKADNHNSGGGGWLYYRRNRKTQHEALYGAAGKGGQYLFEAAACALLESIAHYVHAEQEQRQTAHKGQNVENGHIIINLRKV